MAHCVGAVLERPGLAPPRSMAKVHEMVKSRLAPRRSMSVVPGVILRPVVAVDIDGTLADWHTKFLNFADEWLCRDGIGKEWWDYRGGPLYQHMGISLETYRAIKLAFRQSGLKRSMVEYAGTRTFVDMIVEAGAELWICTTRPYLRLDNIDPDTRFWLERHCISYDGVLFGDSKYRDLAELVGSARVVGVLDDLLEEVVQADTAGLPAYQIERRHNALERVSRPGMTVASLVDAAELFTKLIQDWMVEHNAQ